MALEKVAGSSPVGHPLFCRSFSSRNVCLDTGLSPRSTSSTATDLESRFDVHHEVKEYALRDPMNKPIQHPVSIASPQVEVEAYASSRPTSSSS